MNVYRNFERLTIDMYPRVTGRALVQIEGMGMARIAKTLEEKTHLNVSGRFLTAKAFPPGAMAAVREVLGGAR